MKLLDKIKNALFEEEYVEVEEKTAKIKKEKEKKKKFGGVKVTSYEDEEPVARKIAPIKKQESINNFERRENKVPIFQNNIAPEILDDEIDRRVERDRNIDNKEENNLKVDNSNLNISRRSDNTYYPNNKTEILKPKEERKVFNQENYVDDLVPKNNKEEIFHEEKTKDLYQTSSKDEYIKKNTASEYGNYEKMKAKKVFKPSPNISPIYGIIDDNVNALRESSKKEVRLTSATRPGRVGVDDIRRKAYGTLVDDLTSNLSNEDQEEMKENLLIDLRENNAPEVGTVTMEDAEEYFEDLGLEYDTDYIDATKAKASGRRLKSEENILKEKKEESPKVKIAENEDENKLPSFLQEEDVSKEVNNKIEKEENTNNIDDSDEDDDNLFDLIDSMYEK